MSFINEFIQFIQGIPANLTTLVSSIQNGIDTLTGAVKIMPYAWSYLPGVIQSLIVGVVAVGLGIILYKNLIAKV